MKTSTTISLATAKEKLNGIDWNRVSIVVLKGTLILTAAGMGAVAAIAATPQVIAWAIAAKAAAVSANGTVIASNLMIGAGAFIGAAGATVALQALEKREAKLLAEQMIRQCKEFLGESPEVTVTTTGT
jgi:hypothetical protein